MVHPKIWNRYRLSIGPAGGALLGAALVAAFAAGSTLAWLTSDSPSRPVALAPPSSAAAGPPAPSIQPPIAESSHEESFTPPADPPPAPAPLNREEVRALQKRLQGFGYNPGPIDGNAGRLTVAAAMHYQQDRNLPQSGTIDRTLLEALQQDPAPEIAASSPLVKVSQRSQRSSQKSSRRMEAPRPWQ